MNFDLTDEQKLLAESAERFIHEQYPFATYMRGITDPAQANQVLWKKFAEMGWLALPFAEADGGLGCGAIETMLLMQAFGRGLVTAPYLSTVVIGGEILKHCSSSTQKSSLIAGLINGDYTLAVAYAEPHARYEFAAMTTTATKVNRDGATGWILSGEKSVVLNGGDAAYLIVAARTSGEPSAAHGITLFWLAADTAGVARRRYPLLDGSNGADVTLADVYVSQDAVLGGVGEGLALLQASIDAGLCAIGATALGVMDALLAQTITYCQTRQQFGQAIGKYQVLQHRLVDMFMETEQTRSLVYLANIRLAEAAVSTDDRAANLAIAAMKVQVGKAGRFVGQEAIQLHGGMGMSNDFMVGHYFKKLTAIDAMFGNVDFHLKRFADLKKTGAPQATSKS